MIETGGKLGMQSMDSHIQKLLDAGAVTGEEAYMKAFDKSKFEKHWSFSVEEEEEK